MEHPHAAALYRCVLGVDIDNRFYFALRSEKNNKEGEG